MKYYALDVRLPEQFSIIGTLRAHYPLVTALPCVRGSSQQLQILENGLKKQTADGLYYAVRYLSYMASATVRPEQEASP